MTSPSPDTELAELTTDLIKLAAMVCETVPRGTEILLSGDLTDIQQFIDGDDEIDRLSVEVEDRCHSIMVLHAPKAGDLRLLVTAIKLVAELERSADLMVNITKAARRMYGSPMSPKVRGVIAAMAKEASELLRLSIDAFVDSNDSLARALDDIDDELDQLNRDMVAAIFEAHTDGAINLQVAVQLALVARYYERIGDHAVNIGHRVTYMVTGWLPEHVGAFRAAQHIEDSEHSAPESASRGPEASTRDSRLVRAFSAVPLGIVIGDADGKIVFQNDFMQEFSSGRHSDALVQAAVEELLADAREGLHGQRSLDVFGPPRRYLKLWGTPTIEGSPGNDSMVVVEDTTEAQRIEAVRRDFVANVSHELKTPVGAIGVLAETLINSDDPEVTDRLATRLQSEVFRLANTIDDLLILSRIESEQMEPATEVSVASVIADAVGRTATAAERRLVDITVEGVQPEGTGPCVVGDRAQLVSAVGNLIDNAVKYSDAGSEVQIVVEVESHHGETEPLGETLTITVIDSGIGIPESDRERIFERFYRVDSARSRDTGGTGLGLSIVRHVMLNHDGEVSVQSVEGQGSTFVLRLPALVDCPSSNEAADRAGQ